jgi:hypothetical protein
VEDGFEVGVLIFSSQYRRSDLLGGFGLVDLGAVRWSWAVGILWVLFQWVWFGGSMGWFWFRLVRFWFSGLDWWRLKCCSSWCGFGSAARMFWVLVLFGEFCGFERILQVELSRCGLLFLVG